MPSAAAQDVLQAILERRAAQKRREMAAVQGFGSVNTSPAAPAPVVLPFARQVESLAASKVPPRNEPLPFAKTLSGTIGEGVYGVPLVGPAMLQGAQRIGALNDAAMGKPYGQALEDIQTGQEQFRRNSPFISGSAQQVVPTLFNSVGLGKLGAGAGSLVDAGVWGGDQYVRHPDAPVTAAVVGGLAGASHLPFAAIFAGPMARTANLDALSLAKKMTAEGVPRERIWQETGWFKAPDKEWKFEISDEASRIGGPAMADLAARGETKRPTAGVLHHKDLYAAYPELREIDVNARHATDYPGSSGYYDAVASMKGPEIGIAVKELAGSEGPRSVMLHELQHPVQRIEGFGQGGSPAAYAHGPMFDEKARSLQGALSQELTGGLSHSPKDIIQDIKFVDPARAEEIAREHGFTSIWDALKFLKQQDEMRTPMGQYKRLAGEVEARNVQDRRNMTAEERRATPPWKTQDVPDEQQIVRFRDR